MFEKQEGNVDEVSAHQAGGPIVQALMKCSR